MDNSADSLPGDHLRPEEHEEVKEALRLHMQAHPAPTSQNSSFQERFLKEAAVQFEGEDILQSDEKAAVRDALVAFMDNHPVAIDERVPLNVRIAEALTSFTRTLVPQTVAAFAVVLITGGSIAWAAEDTLPGDVLYSVKTGIVEPIRAAMTNDPAAKAEKMAACARKRLLEAEKLLSSNRLTAENWTELQTNLTTNLDKADSLILQIAETDPETAATLSADLNVMLDMYHQVFDEAGVIWSNTVAVDAAQMINTAAVRFAAHHETNEEKILSDDVSAATLTKRVVHSVSSIVRRLPTDENGNNDANILLKSAEEQLEKGKFRDSLKAARMAIRKAEATEAMIRLGLPVDITTAVEVSSSDSSSSVVTAGKETSSAATATIASPAVASSVHTESSSTVSQASSARKSSKAAVSSKHEEHSSIAPVSSAITATASSTASIVIEVPLPTIPDPVIPVVDDVIDDVTEVVPGLPSLLP